MAKPTNLVEQNQAYCKSFFEGVLVGCESLFTLIVGYNEDEAVKQNLAHGTFTINEEDVEDQSETKIVGLSLGRLGTTSLIIALEMIGYKTINDDEQMEITDIFDACEEDDIDDDEFHEILGLRGYNATFKTDFFWVVNHPEVKAILTVRDDPDKYVDSWLVVAPFLDLVRRTPFRWMETACALVSSLEDEYTVETTGEEPDKYLDRATLRNSYVKYNKDVRDTVPAERLLTFNVKQGWEPLCEFLDVPVPEGIPFPHVHT